MSSKPVCGWHGLRSEREARNKEYAEFQKWLREVYVVDVIGYTNSISVDWNGSCKLDAFSRREHIQPRHLPVRT